MRVILEGSSMFTGLEGQKALFELLSCSHLLPGATVILSGVWPGGDIHGDLWAALHDLKVERHLIDRTKLWKAESERNERLVRAGEGLVVLTQENNCNSANVLRYALRRGIPIERFDITANRVWRSFEVHGLQEAA